ncbi:hypothetical protein Tco_1581351 [Tanacetum coccineum]
MQDVIVFGLRKRTPSILAPTPCQGRTGCTGSKTGKFQLMLPQQYELERKMKQDVLERESRARVDLLESQKIAEDMRVLTMDTSSLDPMNAAIVKAQQARIRAKYPTQE